VAHLLLIAALVLAAGLTIAPRIYHHYDVVDCFLFWARASGGSRPWDVYRADCDYPPLVPYLLTLVERARVELGAAPAGATSIVLVKLPMLAYLAGAPLVWWLLRRARGETAARTASVLFVLSLPLFVNAAAWGQFDALLSAEIVVALAALLAGRPVAAGVALGIALSTKLLAVIAIPTAAVWIALRHGGRSLVKSLAAAALAVALLAAPYVLAGGGRGVLAAYTGAVNYYPQRTIEAYNGWYLLDRFDIFVRGMPAREARADNRRALGPVTFRQLGLAAFAAYLLFVLAGLARRPEPEMLVLSTALALFAFFMLPTQMHQRYIVPAAAVLTLAGGSRPALVLLCGLTVTASLNQALDLARAYVDQAAATDPAWMADPGHYRGLIRVGASLVAVAHVALFAWATVAYARLAARGRRP
jgi:4-amino-4-deoxy-L-arabinose transferase-like glycosyltransferase